MGAGMTPPNVQQKKREQRPRVNWTMPSQAPRIKGVTALDSARIMNDYEHGKGTSDREAADADMQSQVKKAMAQTAYEKGYENMRRAAGFGAQAPAAAVDPMAARRANLIKGGVTGYEADTALQQEAQAKKAAAPVVPAAPPAAVTPAPGVAKPPAPPVVAPVAPVAKVPGTVTDNGVQSSLPDFIAATKQRQSDPTRIGTQGIPAGGGPPAPMSDAARLPAAQQHVSEIQAANAPVAAAAKAMRPTDAQAASVAANQAAGKQAVQDRIYPENSAKNVAVTGANKERVAQVNADDVAALGKNLRPDTQDDDNTIPRANGGLVAAQANGPAVGGTTSWAGLPIPNKRPGRPDADPEAMKKGGPVKTGKKFKIGEKGPELFVPHKKSAPPEVIGKKGPEVGNFKQPGTVIPNAALLDMKQKFSQVGATDMDEDDAPPAKTAPKAKKSPQAA